MEPSPRGDWYSTCFDLSRDPGMPISAPGSPLLPGCRVATACSSLDRFKSHTVGRTEGRKLAGQPKLGDGIRYQSNSLIISLTLSRKYTFVSLRWLLLLRSFVAVQLFCLKVKRYCILLTKKKTANECGNYKGEQECIPVGCVPPAHGLYLPGPGGGGGGVI